MAHDGLRVVIPPNALSVVYAVCIGRSFPTFGLQARPHRKTPALAATSPGRGRTGLEFDVKHGTGIDRLIAKIERQDNECWVWTAYRTPLGYGRFLLNGSAVGAHRAAYMLLVGPIPPGLDLDHLCRNRACVNPAHLEPVAHKTNVMRGDSFSATNATKTHCDNGHEFTEANTYVYTWKNERRRRCRECYNARVRNRRRAERAAGQPRRR